MAAFSVSLRGTRAFAEHLGAALSAQWSFGFPIVPKPGLQLTHGFIHYPAGMQPRSAAHLLEVLPSGVVLDPFVGGGTTLVEALRSGRRPIGADVSPLALFVAAHHTWVPSESDLALLRTQASEDATTSALVGISNDLRLYKLQGWEAQGEHAFTSRRTVQARAIVRQNT